MKTIASFDDAVTFHGHACPGLAIGYRVAVCALEQLADTRAEDEEFVAVVQNDSCAVDAVQLVCGCTFGKGNLVFRDHGKHAYTFFNRDTGKGLRIYAEPVHLDDPDDPRLVELFKKTKKTPGEQAEQRDILDRRIQRLLTLPADEFLRCSPPAITPPERARIFESHACEQCGERVMATRLTVVHDRELCCECAAQG